MALEEVIHKGKSIKARLNINKNLCKTFTDYNKPFELDFYQTYLNLATTVQKSRFRYTYIAQFENLVNIDQELEEFDNTIRVVEIYQTE